jgi:hypothetical protein
VVKKKTRISNVRNIKREKYLKKKKKKTVWTAVPNAKLKIKLTTGKFNSKKKILITT